jgi:riboflavin kinase/FMN adenylyltransferase
MQHFTNLTDIHLGKTWLTIGSFDGVHIGHQALLRKLIEGAHQQQASAVVMTFHPHPAVVLRGRNDPFYLTGQDEKRALLESLGVDGCISIEFNLTVASYTAEYFLHLVYSQMRLERLMVGQGFALGRGRTGDTVMLDKLGRTLGYIVDVIPPVMLDSLIVSSSQIRQFIEQSNLANAQRFLGRPYSVSGIISHGDGRGRGLGFPTANIATSKLRLLPGNGVYACRVKLGEQDFRAVANIGVRPTFEPTGTTPHLEVHLLDFDRDIYGELITIEFEVFLRGEQKFPSVAALVEQIRLDIARTREVLT